MQHVAELPTAVEFAEKWGRKVCLGVSKIMNNSHVRYSLVIICSRVEYLYENETRFTFIKPLLFWFFIHLLELLVCRLGLKVTSVSAIVENASEFQGFHSLKRSTWSIMNGSRHHSTPDWWTCWKLLLYNRCEKYAGYLFRCLHIIKRWTIESIYRFSLASRKLFLVQQLSLTSSKLFKIPTLKHNSTKLKSRA